MKQQVQQLQQDSVVDTEFGKLEQTTSRFIDTGFVKPVVTPVADYAKAIVDSIEQVGRFIQSTDTYKEAATMDKARAITDAQTNMSALMGGLADMVDENGEPISYYQKKVLLNEYLLAQQQQLDDNNSPIYNQEYIATTGGFAQTYAYDLHNQEQAELQEANKTAGIAMITQGTASYDKVRKHFEKRWSKKEASKHILQGMRVKVKQLTKEAISTYPAYVEDFNRRKSTVLGDAALLENTTKLLDKTLKENPLMTRAQALEEIAEERIKQEDAKNGLNNPYDVLLNEVLKVQQYKAKGLNISLVDLSTTESALTKSEVLAAKSALVSLKKIPTQQGGEMTVGNTPVSLTAASETLENQVASTSSAAGGGASTNLNNIMTDVKAKYKQQAMDVFALANTNKLDNIVRDFHNAGFDKEGGLNFIDTYTQAAFDDALHGTPASHAFAHLMQFSSTRATNPDAWGVITKDPRIALTMSMLNKGFSDDKVDILIKNLSAVDAEGTPTHFGEKGFLLLERRGDNLTEDDALKRKEISEMVDRSIIARGNRARYKNYFYKMDELGLLEEEGKDFENVLEEVEKGFYTNLGAPISLYGNDPFTVPADFALSRRLIAKHTNAETGVIDNAVASTFYMAIEKQYGDELQSYGLPVKERVLRDAEGNTIRVDGFDWDDIDKEWEQLSPGEYTLRLTSPKWFGSDVSIPIQLSDKEVADNFINFKKKVQTEQRQMGEQQMWKAYLSDYAAKGGKKDYTFEVWKKQRIEGQSKKTERRRDNREANEIGMDHLKSNIKKNINTLWDYVTGE